MSGLRPAVRNGAAAFLTWLAVPALVAFFYAGVLAGHNDLFDRDLYWFFYQNSHYLAASLRAGHLPLWNPWAFSGEPFLAQAQPGVFYPPHWLYAFLPPRELFSRLLVLHVALCGTLTVLLIREFGGRRVAATLGGIAIAFSGVTVSLITLQSSLFAIAWLPLALWSVVRALTRNSIGYALLGGVVFSLMIFVGGLEVLAMGWVAAGALFALPRLFPLEDSLPGPGRRLALMAAAFGAFLMIGAIQIVPFAELTRYSYRTAGIDPGEAMIWSLSPREWIYFLVPDVFRRGRDFYWQEQNWLRTTYLGVVPLLLAIAGLARGRRRTTGLALLAAACLLLAMGRYLPLYREIFPWLPGLRSIRYPSKFMMLFGLVIAVSAGLGWDALHRRRAPGRGWIALATGAALLVGLAGWFDGPLRDRLAALAVAGRLEMTADAIAHNIRRCLVLLSLASLALYLTGRGGLAGRIGRAAIPILLLVDLGGAMPYATNLYPTDCLEQVPDRIVRLESDPRPFRVFARSRIWDRRFPSYRDMIREGTGLLMPNAAMRHHIQQSQGYRVLTLSRMNQLVRSIDAAADPSRSRLVDLLNIRYLLWDAELAAPGYALLESADSLYLYENRAACDRAFLADEARVLHTGPEFQAIMEDPAFDPRSWVLLDREVDRSRPRERATVGTDGGEVQIVRYEPERITIRVRSPGSRFLVLADAWYPGWRARVNGRDTPVLRADYALRAVPVEAGESVVEFRYEPESLAVGAAVTGGSLLTGLCFLAAGPLRKRIRLRVPRRRQHLPEPRGIEARAAHQ